jgi:hypothetical protein
VGEGAWVSIGKGTSLGIMVGSWVGSGLVVGCSRVGSTGGTEICSLGKFVGLAAVQAAIINSKAVNGIVRLPIDDINLSSKFKTHGYLPAMI